jgi:hypothetical protein
LNWKQFVIELIGLGQCRLVDGVDAAQKVPPLQVPALDGVEAAVTPLGVVAPVSGARGHHWVLGEIKFPCLIE